LTTKKWSSEFLAWKIGDFSEKSEKIFGWIENFCDRIHDPPNFKPDWRRWIRPCFSTHLKVVGLYCSPIYIVLEFVIQVQNGDKGANPKERNVLLARSHSFTFSLWYPISKVVFMNN